MLRKTLFLFVYIFIIPLTLQSDEQVNKTVLDTWIKQKYFSGSSEVPEYTLGKLIRPKTRTKREIRKVNFKVNDEIIALNLIPLKHNVVPYYIPVWNLEIDSSNKLGHAYNKQNVYYDYTYYEDEKHKAILSLAYINGQLFYEGVIGEGKNYTIVKPVPEMWRYTDNDHIFINAREINYTYLDSDYRNFTHLNGLERLPKPLDILYPKLLLMVEETYYQKLGLNSVEEVVKYMTIFWNHVGLKYREILYPKVEITITGIVIQKDEGALDFINKYELENELYLNLTALFNEGYAYFKKKFSEEAKFENYDSVVVMSLFGISGGLAGSALHNDICNKAVIYTTDDTEFGGTITVAHELGHSLGMMHDDDKLTENYDHTSILRGVGTRVTYYDKYQWSQYSIDQLKLFASTKKAECLKRPFQ